MSAHDVPQVDSLGGHVLNLAVIRASQQEPLLNTGPTTFESRSVGSPIGTIGEPGKLRRDAKRPQLSKAKDVRQGKALKGLTVLDLSRRYPGAYTAMFFGDFGAEVIKVDRPGGAPLPVPWGEEGEELAAYYAPDRNKKSILIDLQNDKGREVFYRLVEKADVLIEGFRPGVMQRLKADYDTLKELNPRLVYCSLSGYGQDGPYATRPGHDQNYIAIAGALSFIGPKGGTPCLPANFLADMAGAGLHGAIGILIALQARERTGRGQFVDIGYLDGVISLLSFEATGYFLKGWVPRRGETYNTGGAPWCQVFQCQDGEYYTVSCAEPHLWQNLCRLLGREDLIPYHNPPPEKSQEVIGELQKVFLTRTREEWEAFFRESDVCAGPVYYLNETFEDPQVRYRKMVVEVEHPRLGKVRQVGIPIKLSDTPGGVSSLGVPLGTNTSEILRDLGYSAGQIRGLRRAKAVA